MSACAVCVIEECERTAHLRRGMCNMHWQRWWKYGDPQHVVRTVTRYPPGTVCTVNGCERNDRLSNGLCRLHLQRLRRNGDPTIRIRIRGDVVAQLDRFTDKNGPIPAHRPELGPCWEWTSARTPSGYARVKRQGRDSQAHRVAYEVHVGPIPDGLELDHLCRNRGCVRPDHLEPVTHAENMRRGAPFRRQGGAA
jgi:hypothetical protein